MSAWILLGILALLTLGFVAFVAVSFWMKKQSLKYRTLELKNLGGGATEEDKLWMLKKKDHKFQSYQKLIQSYWTKIVNWIEDKKQVVFGLLNYIFTKESKGTTGDKIQDTLISGKYDTPAYRYVGKWERLDANKLTEDGQCINPRFNNYQSENCGHEFTAGGKKTEGELQYENLKKMEVGE